MTTHRTLPGGGAGLAAVAAGKNRTGRLMLGGLARWLRRGMVVVTTTALGIAVAGLPATAAPDGLSISLRPDSVQLTVGGAARDLTVVVKNNGRRAAEGEAELQVPLGDLGVRLSAAPGSCRANANAMRCAVPKLEPGRSLSIRVKLAPPRESSLQPGDEREGVGRAVVKGRTILDGEGEAQYQVLLSATGMVSEVAGKVIGPDEAPVPDAVIRIKDSDGHQHSTSTGSSGTFRFRASASKPLTPGALEVVATKEGFQPQTKRVTGRSGQPVRDVRFSLLPASATPSETATDDEPAPTDGPATPNAGESTKPAGKDTGLGLFGWFLVVMGILLLGGGTVAIVLLLRRRDGDDDGDDPDDRYSPHTGPIPTSAGPPGVYRSGGGAPPGGAYPTTAMPTQPGGGMDAATMLHERPFVDHVADASTASQAARSHGYDDPTNPRTQVHPARHDEYDGRSDATQVHPAAGRHSTGADDGYGSGRHGRDDPRGYGAEGHGAHGYGADGYGADGYGADGYGRDSHGGPPAGGSRHGADEAGHPDQGYGRRDDDGYGGRRRSVQWGDD